MSLSVANQIHLRDFKQGTSAMSRDGTGQAAPIRRAAHLLECSEVSAVQSSTYSQEQQRMQIQCHQLKHESAELREQLVLSQKVLSSSETDVDLPANESRTSISAHHPLICPCAWQTLAARPFCSACSREQD